ncbi:MAG: NAD(P)/FAD-dependent oxidoreductase [Betaproteobacteria bacterium]|nr:NAD(P)/FAD-dependent oxidoreductase [Betaproteobacteria bacterium]
MEKVECAVIGAGVVGLAIARRLALQGREVVILEAENAFGTHTSSRNSEVIHAGIYYATGSLKAALCVAGKQALYRYCEEHDVKHRRIGKLIVAIDEAQIAGLKKYQAQAGLNGVTDLRRLDPRELRELEPEVSGVAGVLSPSTGIVDSHGLMLAYLGEAEQHGASLALGSPVVSGTVEDDGIVLDVGGAEPMSIRCDAVVNSAGLNAQAVARSIAGVPPQTVPPTHYAIGHYYTLAGRAPFRRLIYPVARQDWLGVHVTVDLGGQVKFGPDFSWIDRVDYRFDESREAAFYAAIRYYYPGLKDGALQPGYTGIRPRTTGPGEPAQDFVIQGPREHGVAGLVNLYGIESPGLTASLAIADCVDNALGAQAAAAPRDVTRANMP